MGQCVPSGIGGLEVALEEGVQVDADASAVGGGASASDTTEDVGSALSEVSADAEGAGVGDWPLCLELFEDLELLAGLELLVDFDLLATERVVILLVVTGDCT